MTPADEYAATLFDEHRPEDAEQLARLRANSGTVFVDRIESQRESLRALLPRPDPHSLDEPPVWAYYPWRRTAVRILGPTAYRRLRLDRNRNKLTGREQQRLAALEVGIVGLSVGHAVALALALEGSCGALRLADFDTVDLSNLNRVPATVFDLGLNKGVVAARRIAEIDPYFRVSVESRGVTAETIGPFLDGLDLVVEECDSLDMKVTVREQARARRLPVLMETSDRGLLDVERFDVEPRRPLFHGLLGDVDSASLAALSTREKVPRVLRLLGAAELSSRMAASLVEVGETVSTWPQLGGDVLLGAATVAAAVRRLGLGQPLPSGRVRVDLDERLTEVRPPAVAAETWHGPDGGEVGMPEDGVTAIVHAAASAPSGGNAQPWRIECDATELRLHLEPDRTTAMDVRFRGSCVALGAALFNARVAAAAHGRLGPVKLFGEGTFLDDAASTLVATMSFGAESDPSLARRYPAVLRRGTNRRAGVPARIDRDTRRALTDAARSEGARLSLLTDRSAVAAVADLLAAAERIRFLEPILHREMIGELRWPGTDSLETGIDVRSLELDDADLATLRVLGRPDAMAMLAQWGLGRALGTLTRDRVRSSSAVAAVTVDGAGPPDFVRGGSAVESVWVAAEEHGLAVQPVSPVFLYGRDAAELTELAPDHDRELAAGRRGLTDLFGLTAGESFALVLRLSHARPASVRSRRRPCDDPAGGDSKG
ncbi:Rv1355c family protein [Rhodococcus olei]|uniref:Rv1355c family protein n=1 Tax=Rhodococcus olei TaxID=2161675 RepID=A0ABP8NQM4_9NOCA